MKIIKKMSIMFTVITLMCTCFLLVNNKTESKACMGRKKIKKCAISLKDPSYVDWTGSAIEPKLNVNYKGTELVEDVDYVLYYTDNIDAGIGHIQVKGKGKYKGNAYVRFGINGIDISDECTYTYNKGTINLYHNGELVDPINYTIATQKDTVDVKYIKHVVYVVTGKGQYTGTIYILGEEAQ